MTYTVSSGTLNSTIPYLTILHFPSGGSNDAQNVSVDTAHGKDNDQQNLYKK